MINRKTISRTYSQVSSFNKNLLQSWNNRNCFSIINMFPSNGVFPDRKMCTFVCSSVMPFYCLDCNYHHTCDRWSIFPDRWSLSHRFFFEISWSESYYSRCSAYATTLGTTLVLHAVMTGVLPCVFRLEIGWKFLKSNFRIFPKNVFSTQKCRYNISDNTA